MCGIVAVLGGDDAWGAARRGLGLLQHRGQQGAGVLGLSSEHAPVSVMGAGLVERAVPRGLGPVTPCHAAVGHTRYATSGDPGIVVQPFLGAIGGTPFGLAHNGQVGLREAGRRLLAGRGRSFDAVTDSAWLVALIEVGEGDLTQRIARLAELVDGAYSLVVATPDEVVGARDRLGLRPLFVGRAPSSDAVAIASEPVALGAAEQGGIVWERSIRAGEIVSAQRGGGSVRSLGVEGREALCLLETIYFAAGTTTLVPGRDVEARRELLGEALAGEAPVAADVVVGVPSSGSAAARGYARATGLPLGQGLRRSSGALRAFLASDEASRARIAHEKLAVDVDIVRGRTVVVVDDSIVRGTTSRAVATMLREAGARELHLRLSSPPLRHPCFYGVDMPSREQLAVPRHGPALATALGYDSVAFLSLEATRRIAGGPSCDACFTGRYPDLDTSERAVHCSP